MLPLEGSDASMRQVFSHITAFRLASVVTAINVLVATGFSIAGVVATANILPATDAPADTSFVFALYAAARALPLAGFVLVAIYKRASSSLLVLGGLAGVAQFLDAGIGVIQHDPTRPAARSLSRCCRCWPCGAYPAPCRSSWFKVYALNHGERFLGFRPS
jgi:hypothetical protein